MCRFSTVPQPRCSRARVLHKLNLCRSKVSFLGKNMSHFLDRKDLGSQPEPGLYFRTSELYQEFIRLVEIN